MKIQEFPTKNLAVGHPENFYFTENCDKFICDVINKSPLNSDEIPIKLIIPRDT